MRIVNSRAAVRLPWRRRNKRSPQAALHRDIFQISVPPAPQVLRELEGRQTQDIVRIFVPGALVALLRSRGKVAFATAEGKLEGKVEASIQTSCQSGRVLDEKFRYISGLGSAISVTKIVFILPLSKSSRIR